MLTLGSLFDGIGGFCLAGQMCGIKPVWSSEIESFPLKVTEARFPDVKQLGSVTDINGADIEPVDIITFGSPCQDLSVAGKQLGIHEGQRSNLFFEAIRIIKEMRKADEARGRSGKSIRPRFAVWENVSGAYSSNKGNDFHSVLQAFCEIGGGKSTDDVPMPKKRRWEHNGCIVGDGYSLAWKTLDAQYCGVPQRRKRIYLIADFGSERAGEILLVKSGVSGHFTENRTPWEGTATDAERSIGRSCGVRCLNPWDCQSKRQHDVNGVYPTLQAYDGGGGRCDGVCYEVAAFMGGQGAKARSIAYCNKGTTPTLKSSPSGGNTVPDVDYAIQGNGIDRSDTAGCNGKGWRTDQMYTLDTIDRPAVAFAWANSAKAGLSDSKVAPTMKATSGGEPAVCFQQNQRDEVRNMGEQAGAYTAQPGIHNQNYVCYGVDCRNATLDEEKVHTLQAKANGGISLNCTPSVCYRNGGYGDMVEGIGTLRANGGDAGYSSENIVVEKHE